MFGTNKTELTHFVEVGKALNLLVFLLQKHLNEEHFTLFLDQIPAILSVLRALDRHVEAGAMPPLLLLLAIPFTLSHGNAYSLVGIDHMEVGFGLVHL